MLLIVSMSLAAHGSFAWTPRFRVGAQFGYACTADDGTRELTTIEVLDETETGFGLRFRHDADDALVVEVDPRGRPIAIRDPEATAQAWRAKQRETFEQESAPEALLLARGIVEAPTVGDLVAYELARASVFLPVTGNRIPAEPTPTASVLTHPLYRGGGAASGTVNRTRLGLLTADVAITLDSDDGVFVDLSTRTLILSNDPEADLRFPFLVLAGLGVEETRAMRIRRRSGWPTRIERVVTTASPFGANTRRWVCR